MRAKITITQDDSVAEMLDFVSRSPGALGHLVAAAPGAGIHLICRG